MPIQVGQDSAKTRRNLEVGDRTYAYYSLAAAEEAGLGRFGSLPASMKVLVENLLRYEDDATVTQDDIRALLLKESIVLIGRGPYHAESRTVPG